MFALRANAHLLKANQLGLACPLYTVIDFSQASDCQIDILELLAIKGHFAAS